MIEDQLRAELGAHMAGATPATDWAAAAEQSTRRRHRRQLAGTLVAAVALAGIVVGTVTLPRHEERGVLNPAAPPPSPASASPPPTDYVTAIAAPDNAWTIGFRTTADQAAAVCLDVARVGVRGLVTACAPDNPSDVSYHHVTVTRDGKQSTLVFGLVPAGTRSVALLSRTGAGSVATLTPQPIHGAEPLVWFAEEEQQPTSASALLADGTTVDLLSAQKKSCAGDPTEVPDNEPCASTDPPTTPTVPVQSGYGHDETFCSARGELHYVVSGGSVTLTSTLTGLPRDTLLGFDWINDPVRGYDVASEHTTTAGTLDPATLTMVRPGEVRGIAMQVTDGDTVVLRLTAC